MYENVFEQKNQKFIKKTRNFKEQINSIFSPKGSYPKHWEEYSGHFPD